MGTPETPVESSVIKVTIFSSKERALETLDFLYEELYLANNRLDEPKLIFPGTGNSPFTISNLAQKVKEQCLLLGASEFDVTRLHMTHAPDERKEGLYSIFKMSIGSLDTPEEMSIRVEEIKSIREEFGMSDDD